MIRVKTSLDHKRIRCLVWLVLTLFVLLGYSLQSVAGNAYYSMLMQNYATVSSPPVILQNGTAGTSTIYANKTSAKTSVKAPLFDYVDNNDSDVDSSADRGMHSNFTAQQAGPDSTYDPLTEESTGAGEGGVIEDYVDNNTSDVDSSTDLGSHSNFENQKDKDYVYDTLSEENTGGTGTDIEDYVDATSDIDSSPDIGNHSNFENQKSKDATYDTLTEETVTVGDWGITETLPSPANWPNYRYMGGISPDIEGMNITKIHIYCSTAGTMAVGVWTGGSLSNPVGAVKRTEAYNVSVVAGWNEIDVPDYSWPANTVTWIGWTCDDTVQVYASSSSSDSGDFQSARGRYSQTNPATADPTQPMNSTIGAGSFSNWWYVMYLEYDRPDTYQLDLEVQFTGLDFDEINEELCIYAGSTDAENITVDYWTGSGWSNLLTDLASNTWNNVSVSLTSATFTIRFVDGTPEGDTNQDSWQIDACLVHVWGNPQNWELDLEVQFTDFVDFLSIEKLCIYAGTLGSEDLEVDYWNGTGWENVATDLTADSWNNYTVSLTSPTFTIRFKDGTTVGDTVAQDQWQIDASLLRVEGAGSKEDAVDNDASDVDSSSDLGILSNFNSMETKDGYATLQEGYLTTGGSWGKTDDADGTQTTTAHSRAMGGTSPNKDNMKIMNISIYLGAQTGDVRLAIYTGGSLSDPSSATLLWDAGTVNPNGVQGWYTISYGGGLSWSKNTVTWLAWKRDSGVGVFYESGTPPAGSGVSGDFQGDRGRDDNNFNQSAAASFPSTYGDTGSFTNYWYMIHVNYVIDPNPYRLDQEVQWTSVHHQLTNEELCIYTGTTNTEDIVVDVWNGSDWEQVFSDLNASTWNNASITGWLTSSTFTIRFRDGTPTSDSSQSSWQIDVVLIHVWQGGENYELDLEVQWTGADYTWTNEELCIKTGTFSGSENIQVRAWNNTGSSWHWVMNLTANQWNNVSITSYLTSNTFTVQYLGGTETGDTSEDSWNIDATLLHVWTSQDTLDYVDNNTSDEGSPTDRGTHSNFTAQQYAPDSIYDTLTEEYNVGSIIYENSAESNSVTGQSSHNFDYSLQKGSGNDRLVVVTVSWEDAEASAIISSLTFGGTGMTKIIDVTVGTGYSEYISLWYLLDSSLPSSSGSYNIAVTVNDTITREIYMAAAEYSGVEQSAPDDSDTDANILGGDTSITLTAAADGSVVVAGVGEGGTNVLTNTNNIVNLQEQVLASSGSALGHQTNVSSGNITVGWNNLGTREGMAGAVWQPSTNYELDLEVQWTGAEYNKTNEEVAIYVKGNNTHSLDATGGYMIIGNGTVDWGSTTGTISFWIRWDTVDYRPWGQHGNMETRFSGGSNLIVDFGADNSTVSNTSFTANKWYFIAIVWDENTDDLYLYVGDQDNPPAQDAYNNNWTSTISTLGVTQNNFLASRNGFEPTDGQGDELRYWNVDRTLAEIQSDYDTKLTGSETNLRSYFKLNNNFDDIGPDNNDGSGSGSYSFAFDVPFDPLSAENIRVDAWTGSAWQNLFTDLTSGWNNASVSSYLTSSTFTIRFKGDNETGDTSQDSWNIDTTLLHVWTNEGTYDYVLRVNNTVADSWQIRLKKYSDSNISRLQDCTIYFHNSTDGTSTQIDIQDGSYVNQTGPWYDLGDSETIYIAMTVQANSAATSYVYTYLEIRTPNTTTYAQYVITFEIT